MKINVNYISEKDIDLLFIEEMISDEDFRVKILNRINRTDMEIVEVFHSLTHPILGESDITIVFEDNEKKFGLLIEDKIDAIAMPRQFERYLERGRQHISDGLFNEFDIMIIAPESYLETNHEASNYPNSISYEEIISFFSRDKVRDLYKITLLENAIDKKRKGYTPIKDEMVTDFWTKYYEFKNANYPNLLLNEVKGPRGKDAVWPWFKTINKGIKIAHKSDRGFTDLTLVGTSQDFTKIYNNLKNNLEEDMEILKVAKSTVVRIKVPEIDFTEPFNNFTEELFYIFDKIEKLNRFVVEHDLKRFV